MVRIEAKMNPSLKFYPGSFTLTGAEYIKLVTGFIAGCEMDLASSSAVTQALALTSVSTTLTVEQVKSSTILVYSLSKLVRHFNDYYTVDCPKQVSLQRACIYTHMTFGSSD